MTKRGGFGILCKLSDTDEHFEGAEKKVSEKMKKVLDKERLVW